MNNEVDVENGEVERVAPMVDFFPERWSDNRNENLFCRRPLSAMIAGSPGIQTATYCCMDEAEASMEAFIRETAAQQKAATKTGLSHAHSPSLVRARGGRRGETTER